MGLLGKIEAFLDGKKTYIVAIISGVLGLLAAMGHPVPEWVYSLLAAAGLAAVRSAVGTGK